MATKSLATTFSSYVLSAAARDSLALAVLLALLASLALSENAAAATHAPTYCERNSAFFANQNDDDLTVSKVDLGKSDVQTNFSDSDDEQRTAADAALAPLLYLAPRVESILDDVFEDHQGETSDNEPAASVNGTVAPVADTSAPSGDEVVPVEPQELDDQPVLLRIQREMYRTDI